MEHFIRNELNNMAPLKNCKVKEIKGITDGTLEEIKDKDDYIKIAEATMTKEDWAMARRERNIVGRFYSHD